MSASPQELLQRKTDYCLQALSKLTNSWDQAAAWSEFITSGRAQEADLDRVIDALCDCARDVVDATQRQHLESAALAAREFRTREALDRERDRASSLDEVASIL